MGKWKYVVYKNILRKEPGAVVQIALIKANPCVMPDRFNHCDSCSWQSWVMHTERQQKYQVDMIQLIVLTLIVSVKFQGKQNKTKHFIDKLWLQRIEDRGIPAILWLNSVLFCKPDITTTISVMFCRYQPQKILTESLSSMWHSYDVFLIATTLQAENRCLFPNTFFVAVFYHWYI